ELAAPASADVERPACPRCGELLPAAIRSLLPTAPPVEASPSPPPRAQLPGKRRTVAAILAVMACMAAISAVFIWFTTGFRRHNDFRTLKPRTVTPAAPVGSASLVGYLPPRCNVLASVHVTELLRRPDSKSFLEQTRPLGLEWLLERLEQWTGLKLQEFEQIALGSEIIGRLPQLFVVLQTRRPFEAPHGFPAGKAGPSQLYRGRPLYRFGLQPIGEAILWRHSERLLVVVACFDAAKTNDLDGVPDRPHNGFDGLTHALRAALTQRLPAGCPLWIAGNFDNAAWLRNLPLSRGWPGLELVAMTSTMVVALEPQETTTLVGHLRPADVKNVDRLVELLTKEPTRLPGLKVVGPPPDAKSDEAWVTFQARGQVGDWLAKLWTRAEGNK
ncbi:MAG: hypothetical protein NZO58_12965, partial [Gemmataceae bacterium]|nr:hypothetical protein [Gemmataceae bacterium]